MIATFYDGKVEYHDIKSMNSGIIKQYADSLKPYVSFKSSGKSSPYLSLKVRTKGT